MKPSAKAKNAEHAAKFFGGRFMAALKKVMQSKKLADKTGKAGEAGTGLAECEEAATGLAEGAAAPPPLPPPPLENAEPVAAEGLALKDVVRICSDEYGVASCAAEGEIVEFLKGGSEVAIKQANFLKRVAQVKDVRLVKSLKAVQVQNLTKARSADRCMARGVRLGSSRAHGCSFLC